MRTNRSCPTSLALALLASSCVYYTHELAPQPSTLSPIGPEPASTSLEFRKLAPRDMARFDRALRIDDPLPAAAEKIEPFEAENRAQFVDMLRASGVFAALEGSGQPGADHLRVFLAEYPDHTPWWPISGLTLTIIPAWTVWHFEIYAERSQSGAARRTCHLHESFRIVAWLPLLPFALVQWPSDSEIRVRHDLYFEMLQELGYAAPIAVKEPVRPKGNE